MKSVKVGVVGVGGICQGIHLPALSHIGGCEIAWLCDTDISKAKNAADKYGIPKYGTLYSELLRNDRPDAVFVLVQPDQSFRICEDCMNAGCHVFCEKPFGITLYQAETLSRLSCERGVMIQTGYNRRFIPVCTEAIKKVTELGSVCQVDGWFYKNGDAAFYGGCSSAFMCDAIHTIDFLRYAAGLPGVESAVTMNGRSNSPVDNIWNSLIRFDNGVVATLHSNYDTGGRVHGFAIHNSFASAYINIGFGDQECSAKIVYNIESTYSISAHGAGKQRIEYLDGREIAGSNDYFCYYGYLAEDMAFIDAISNCRNVPCGASDSLDTMRLADILENNLI